MSTGRLDTEVQEEGQSRYAALKALYGDSDLAKSLMGAAGHIRGLGEAIPASGDVVDLKLLLALHDEVESAAKRAVDGLRAQGLSWADIGAGLGVHRSSAQQRFGR